MIDTVLNQHGEFHDLQAVVREYVRVGILKIPGVASVALHNIENDGVVVSIVDTDGNPSTASSPSKLGATLG
jgi:hypothetical protein